MSYTRYTKLQKWVSNDNGISWIATEEYKKGDKIGEFETMLECEDSGQDPNLQRGYRWINMPIESDWECFNGSKYYRQQRQYTTDKGQTWHDMDEYRMGALYETNSNDCRVIEPIYEWRNYNINEKHDCNGYNAYYIEYEVVSKDEGITWSVTGQERRGSLYESNSELCGYVPEPDCEPYSIIYSAKNYDNFANTSFRLNDKAVNRFPIYSNDVIITFDTDNVTSLYHFGWKNNNITKVKFLCDWGKKLTNLKEVFYSCLNIEDVDMSNLDVSKVTTMQNMFYNNIKLKYINLSGWNTESLTDMSEMFDDNGVNIEKIDGISDFNTHNVKTLYRTFVGCKKLNDLDLSKWDVSNVENGYAAFSSCEEIKRINLSGWNTESLTDIGGMFADCYNLEKIDGIENFTTSKITSLRGVFSHCHKLNDLDLSKWDVSNVENMEYLFDGCTELTNLNVNTWNIENTTNFHLTFARCINITNIDLSNWRNSKTISMNSMFYACTKLETLDVSGLDISNSNIDDMFKDCTSLKTVKCKQSFRDRCYTYIGTIGLNPDTINWVITD